MSVSDVLRKSPLCNGLSDAEIEEVTPLFHSRHAKKDEVILKEGEQSQDLYIISRGRVSIQIYSSRSPGQRERIAILRDNEVYGEFAMIDGSTRSASVIVEEDSNFIYVNYLDFHRFLEVHEHIGFIVMRNIAKILTQKLRATNLEIRNGTV